MRAPNLRLGALAAIASAIPAYLGTGLQPLWPLLWLAPIPMLVVAPGLRGGVSFLLASFAWFLGEINQWTYFTRILGIPWPIVILFLVIPALLFGLGVLLTRSLLVRQSPILAALTFPTYWVTWEYLSAVSSPHSTFGNLGYTQMDCLSLIQIASVTGIWALSFCVFLFAGTVAALLSGVGSRSSRRALVLGVGVVLVAVFAFGEWRLMTKPDGEPVPVTLVAKDVPMSVYLGSDDQAVRLLGDYANEVTRVTPAGTQAVVLPEKIGRVSENALPQIDALFSAAASATRAAIDLGLVRKTATGSYNSARFYSADGNVG